MMKTAPKSGESGESLVSVAISQDRLAIHEPMRVSMVSVDSGVAADLPRLHKYRTYVR